MTPTPYTPSAALPRVTGYPRAELLPARGASIRSSTGQSRGLLSPRFGVRIPAGGPVSMSVSRSGSAAVSKTAGRGSIPRTFANTHGGLCGPAMGRPRAVSLYPARALPPAVCDTRAGGLFPEVAA